MRLRTKKNDLNSSENVSGDDKVDQEQIKKEITEKKSEKTIKEEKKEYTAKEKKSMGSSTVGQVTTRSRKTVAENKEVDVKTEETTEKAGKTKKTKRKAETSPVAIKRDTATDVDMVVKKKKTIEKKPPRCPQGSQKRESKLEAAKKQNSCLKKNKKKKSLKIKTSKNNKKPGLQKAVDGQAIPEKSPLLPVGEGKRSDGSRNEQQRVIAPDDGKGLSGLGGNQQDQELPPAQQIEKNVDMGMKDQEMPIVAAEGEETAKIVSENEIAIELACMSKTSSGNLSNTTSEGTTGELNVVLSDSAREIQPTQNCEMEVMTDPDLIQEIKPAQSVEIESVVNLHPDDHSPTKELQAEDSVRTPPPLQLPETSEQSSRAGRVSASHSGTAVNENQETEEDEGIHSHDGSDISDNISEGSDDSGLNGARSVQEKASPKPSQEVAETKTTQENYVCIFCDRSFKKEGEYSKHLNRHLVNVYYLEKATKGQD